MQINSQFKYKYYIKAISHIEKIRLWLIKNESYKKTVIESLLYLG